jgi:hypothetical protein
MLPDQSITSVLDRLGAEHVNDPTRGGNRDGSQQDLAAIASAEAWLLIASVEFLTPRVART